MKSLFTTKPRAATEPEDTVQQAREDALDEIFRYAAIIAGAAALLSLSGGLTSLVTSLPLWFDTALCLAFIGLSTSHLKSFRLRAALLVGVLYAAAIGAFVIFGLGGCGAAFLIAAAMTAAVFLGFRAGAGATGFAVITGLGFTYLYLSTPFQPQLGPALLNSWGGWAAIGANLVLVFAILIVPQRPLWEAQSFVLAVSKSKQELLDARATLQKQATQLEAVSANLAQANRQLADQSRALERRAQQLSAAAEIGRAATSTFDLPSLLETSVQLIHDRFDFYHASVFIIEPGSKVAELRESTGDAGRELKARKHKLAVGSKSLVGTATATRQPVIVQDVTADPNYYPNPLLPDTRAEAVLPLLRGDAVIGAIDVQSTQPNSFVEGDLAILATMADQLAVAVQNARLYSETQAALAENASLFKISAALAEANSLADIVDIVAKHALPRGATRVALAMIRYDADGLPADLDIRAFYDSEGKLQRVGLRVPVASTPLVTKLGFTPLTISDIYSDPQMDPVSRETMARLEMVATCFVPLRVGGRLVGAILTSSAQPTDFNPQEVTLLRSITDPIVVTMEKIRLLAETSRRAEQLAAAADIGRAATSTFDLAVLLETTVNQIRNRFDFYHASVFIIEPGSRVAEIRESTGEAGRKLKERKHKLAVGSKSLVGTATATRQPVIVQDVRADPHYYPNPLLPDTRAEAVLPMLSGETIIGAVDVQSTQPNAFIESELAILSTIVGQLAVAIQNARLYVESQTRLNELSTLNQISRAISSTIDIDEVYRAVRDQLVATLGVDNIYLGLYDEAQDLISFPFMLERGQLIPFEPRTPSGRTHYIIHSRQPLRLEGDAAQVAEQLQRLGISPSSVSKSYLGVPLLLGERAMGVLVAQDYDRANTFNANHERVLTTIADQLVVAIQNGRLYAETQAALAENAALFKVSRALSEVDSLDGILEAVAADAMPRGATRAALLWLHYNEQGEPAEIEVRAHLDITGEHDERPGLRFPAEAAPLLAHLPPEPLVIANLDTQEPLDPQTRETLRQMQIMSTCLIPLFTRGRLVGAITTSAGQPIEFQAKDISVLRGVGDLIAVTLEKLRLTDETRRRAEQLAAAAEIGRAATASFDLSSALETTVNLIRERFGFYHASIFIVPLGSNVAELRESTGEAGRQLKARQHKLAVGSQSLVGTATATRQPVVVQDVTADSNYYPNPLLPDTRAEAVIPLIAGETVVGAVDVQSTVRGAFSQGDLAVLSTIAGQLAVAVQNARLFEQTARRASREQLASQITNKIRSVAAGDIDGMLRTAVTELRQALGTSYGAVQLRVTTAPEPAPLAPAVQYCEKTPACPFFNEKMANFPENARSLKAIYCLNDKSKCARYRVSKALGGPAVPADLYPFDGERADQILLSSQPEARNQP